MKIIINKQTPPLIVREYPYFATNFSENLFLVLKKDYGIAIGLWEDVRLISEDMLTPLPVGTIITITE